MHVEVTPLNTKLKYTFIFKISSETKNGHRHLESLGTKRGQLEGIN
jgi:hypothetical protein